MGDTVNKQAKTKTYQNLRWKKYDFLSKEEKDQILTQLSMFYNTYTKEQQADLCNRILSRGGGTYWRYFKQQKWWDWIE